jgi:hypothetical protein
MAAQGVGYRYVALRPLTVSYRDDAGTIVEHALGAGDVVPEEVEWRNPKVWVDQGHIAVFTPSNKPGRPARNVDVSGPALGEPVVGSGPEATADVVNSDPAVTDPTSKVDFEDLAGKPSPDGYPAFRGETDMATPPNADNDLAVRRAASLTAAENVPPERKTLQD